MLNPTQLLEVVVRPALNGLGDTQSALELVMGTAAQESRLHYLKQLGTGPALGLWQMEPATHDDIWENFLAYRPDIAARLRRILSSDNSLGEPDSGELAWNLKYGAAMCRVHYLRVREPLPPAGDVLAHSNYWKRWYNTALGSGTALEYVRNYELVRPSLELKETS